MVDSDNTPVDGLKIALTTHVHEFVDKHIMSNKDPQIQQITI